MNSQNMMAVFQSGDNPHREALDLFMRMPLDGTDEVFTPFTTLPGAVEGRGKKAFQRFVYVPGSREDRVLLVAHADTIWDRRYGGEPIPFREVQYSMGMYYSLSKKHGIGADGRAGCAMLWVLRESGHSLLILDGEERGRNGVLYLKESYPKLFREINRTHRFAIALDAPGNGLCAFDQPDSSVAFRRYITSELGVHDDGERYGSDICVLCHRISGVNVGVGYVNQHYAEEVLFGGNWAKVYEKVEAFLKLEQPKFPISRKLRMKRKLKRLSRAPRKLMRMLRR